MRRPGRRDWNDGPAPMQSGLQRVMNHLGAPKTSIVQSVFDEWPSLVGDVIAAHAKPSKIVHGTLVIDVDEPAWASELNWMADELLSQLRTRLDTNEINKISVNLTR